MAALPDIPAVAMPCARGPEAAVALTLDRMPGYIKRNIFEFLALPDLAQLRVTGKQWNTHSIKYLTGSMTSFIGAISARLGDKISPENQKKLREIASDGKPPFQTRLAHKKAIYDILSALDKEGKLALYELIGKIPYSLEDIVLRLRYEKLQPNELCTIAEEYVREGRLRRALEAVNSISCGYLKSEPLCEIARAYSKAGGLRQALSIVDSMPIEGESLKPGILRSILFPCIKAGDLGRAFTIITESSSDPLAKTGAFCDIAQAYIEIRDLERARVVAHSIPAPIGKARIFLSLALAEYHKVWDQAQARLRIEEVLGIARSISDPDEKLRAFEGIAQAYIEIRDLERAQETAESISSAATKSEVLADIAQKWSYPGELELPRALLDRALEVAGSISDDFSKSSALCHIARRYIAVRDLDQTRMVLELALEVALSITPCNRPKSALLMHIAQLHVEAKGIERALEIAHLIPDEETKSQSLADIAHQSGTG